MRNLKFATLVLGVVAFATSPAHAQLLKCLNNNQERELAHSKVWRGDGPDVVVPLHFLPSIRPTRVVVGRDHPNGTKLLAMFHNCGVRLPVDFGKDFEGFDEWGYLSDGYVIQIGEHDFNGDGTPEIVVAVGNGATDLSVNVLRYRPPTSAKNACSEKNWSRLGSFTGQANAILTGKRLVLPYGSQGLFEEYTFSKEKFAKTN